MLCYPHTTHDGIFSSQILVPWAWVASPAAPESPWSSSSHTLSRGFTPQHKWDLSLKAKRISHVISPNALKLLPFFPLSLFLASSGETLDAWEAVAGGACRSGMGRAKPCPALRVSRDFPRPPEQHSQQSHVVDI